MKNLKPIAYAILTIGLAAISVWAWLSSNGEIGDGWAIVAVLVLLFASTD